MAEPTSGASTACAACGRLPESRSIRCAYCPSTDGASASSDAGRERFSAATLVYVLGLMVMVLWSNWVGLLGWVLGWALGCFFSLRAADTPRRVGPTSGQYLGSRLDGEQGVRDIQRGKRADAVIARPWPPRVLPQQIRSRRADDGSQAVAKPDPSMED